MSSLVERLCNNADSWEESGAVRFDCAVARDPEQEAALLREAAARIEELERWIQPAIESLRSRLSALIAAAGPFVALWETEQAESALTDEEARAIDSYVWFTLRGYDGAALATMTSGDLRALAAAVKAAQETGDADG